MRLLWVFLFVAAVAFAQTDCAIDGTVVNSVTGLPIQRAHVSVVSAEDRAVADSDATGKWDVRHISCGTVKVAAERVGYFTGGKGAAVTLVAGTPAHDTKLQLVPQAVISGRVTDDQGDAIERADVTVITSRVVNGIRSYQGKISTAADDRGEYRFSGLTAGRYLVCAAGPISFFGGADGSRQYGNKCFPGPLAAGASIAMNVSPGYEGRVDFALPLLATFQVRGTLTGLPAGVQGQVVLKFGDRFLSGTARKDNTFVFHNVPPGDYILAAEADNQSYGAHMPLSVGARDVEGVQLRLEPNVSVTGSVKVISSTGRKFNAPFTNAFVKSADGAQQSSQDATGPSFTWPNIAPGRYRLEFFTSGGLYVKSVTMGDRDVMRSEVVIGQGSPPLEVVLSDDGGVVEGDIKVDDALVPGWVMLQSEGRPLYQADVGETGHFRIDNLPPGDYKAYAWDDKENVEYANPDWMQRNAKGKALTVQPAQTQKITLTRQAVTVE